MILVFESVKDVRQSCIGLLQGSEVVSNDAKPYLYQMDKLYSLLQVCLLLKKR